MSGIQRYDRTSLSMWPSEDGLYVRYSDHEAEVARLRAEASGLSESLTDALECEKDYLLEISELRAEVEENEKAMNVWRGRTQRAEAEVERLRNALTPFSEFALVRSAAGSTSPKTGPVYSVHTRLGEAEITAEDFEAAFNAIGASA